MWNVIAQLASRQHGVVSRQQLLDLGCSSGQVGGLVRRGRLQRESRGTYAITGTARTSLTPVMAAVLRAGSGARAAGERLLAASGVRDASVDGRFSVLVPVGRRIQVDDIDWRPDTFPSCGITATVQGVPTWGVPRNLLEAATSADAELVARLADGVRRTSRARMGSVAGLVARHPDHPGGRRLLLLGCLDLDAAESHAERLLEVVLRDLRPQRQVRLAHDIRVDFLLPDLRVVVEYDGSDHESGRARAADAERDARLAALGYVVVRVTRHDLREPAALLARIHLAATARR